MASMNQTKKSIGISLATQYLELVIQFLSVLVLARILSPADTGTYSVAAFMMTLLHVFRDFGVVQYIIQERDLTTEKIRSAMGVAIILALAVASILLACSGAIARFYGDPAVEKILQVMAASFAISPFGSLLIGIFRREMRLQTVFIIKIVSALCHVAVALTLALHGFGAMSLAWANFAGILAFGVVGNLLRPKGIPWLPHFKNAKTILSYGSIASVGNAAGIAGTNTPDLVIGKVMNMAAVGYFSRANGLLQLFTKLITDALLPLVLPYFAQMRREGKEFSATYRMSVSYLTVLAWPFFAVLFLLADPIVLTLYGVQWEPSVPIVQVLCFAGAIASISLFAGQVMVANGEVRRATLAQLTIQPFRVVAVLIGAMYGLREVGMALIAAEALSLLVMSRFLRAAIDVGLNDLVKSCGKSALVTVCTIPVPLLTYLVWSNAGPHTWFALLAGIPGAAVGWIAGVIATRHPLADHVIAVVPPLRSFFQRADARKDRMQGG